MKWIQTNCELPRVMMDKEISGVDCNLEMNDFDFVLFHLYNSDPWYKQYYKEMRNNHPDRLMILDNSAYEFYVKGEELDQNAYQRAIEELNPDYYIVPDMLMNRTATIEYYDEYIAFARKYSMDCKLRRLHISKPMFVLQGEYEDDLMNCFEIIDTKIKLAFYGRQCISDWFNICIPFHNNFFKYIEPENQVMKEFLDKYSKNGSLSDDLRYALGRVIFFTKHLNKFDKCGRIHFLGSHCPYEKAFYNRLFNQGYPTMTMDTGYPVKLGYTKQFLGAEKEKPNVIIDDFFNHALDNDTQVYIKANIHMFKQYS